MKIDLKNFNNIVNKLEKKFIGNKGVEVGYITNEELKERASKNILGCISEWYIDILNKTFIMHIPSRDFLQKAVDADYKSWIDDFNSNLENGFSLNENLKDIGKKIQKSIVKAINRPDYIPNAAYPTLWYKEKKGYGDHPLIMTGEMRDNTEIRLI